MFTRLLVTTALVIASVGIATPAQAAPAIQLDKIQYDSPGSDTGTNDSLNAEWVRIKNTSTTTRTLTGWTLRDVANHVYTFPTTTLAGGAWLYVRTGSGTNTSSRKYWGKDWYVWNNSGSEQVRLKNSSGTLIDSCDYTGSSAGYKTC